MRNTLSPCSCSRACLFSAIGPWKHLPRSSSSARWCLLRSEWKRGSSLSMENGQGTRPSCDPRDSCWLEQLKSGKKNTHWLVQINPNTSRLIQDFCRLYPFVRNHARDSLENSANNKYQSVYVVTMDMGTCRTWTHFDQGSGTLCLMRWSFEWVPNQRALWPGNAKKESCIFRQKPCQLYRNWHTCAPPRRVHPDHESLGLLTTARKMFALPKTIPATTSKGPQVNRVDPQHLGYATF